MVNPEFWRGRRVLVTGHTGFKGGWLSLWLSKTGAHVTGLALAPEGRPNFFDVVRLGGAMADRRGDIADLTAVKGAFEASSPEIVFHMAAQALVRRSYIDPVETYRTNVLGSAHILDVARRNANVKAIILVTSDKCYENKEWHWAYRETDRLGGKDPYSNSKACAELVASAFRQSYFCAEPASGAPSGARLATVRAGNVIGGGDWSEDRIVPDIVRSILSQKPVEIRNPSATRPWQHVMEPLRGYLMLAENLYNGANDSGYNFGPDPENETTVAELVRLLTHYFSDAPGAKPSKGAHPKEAQFLRLDSSKARAELGWRPLMGLQETLKATAEWFKAWVEKQDMRAFTIGQIQEFESKSRRAVAHADQDLSA
jgi:CDP-glucose 4,6-dehydratase